MKILSIEEFEDRIKVTTDNLSRPEFVYLADKFGDLASLKHEMEKSIWLEEKRVQKKKVKIDNIMDSFINLDGKINNGRNKY